MTTVGGLLGTDGVTRHVDAVLAKANSLEEEGVSSFIMSGGYPVPSPTLTGSIRSDIAFIEKVRGGKIAIADHRVAPVSAETLLAVATEARIGGMLRGFIGHVDHAYRRGGGRAFLCIRRAGTRAALGAPPDRHAHQPQPLAPFPKLPNWLPKAAHGYSSGLNVQTLGPDTLKPSEAIALAMRQGVAKERILMSSDGNGSAARYGDDGSVSGLVASDLGSLHTEFADCVKEGMPLSEALCPITRNVAQAFLTLPEGTYRGRRRCRHPVARARSGPCIPLSRAASA